MRRADAHAKGCTITGSMFAFRYNAIGCKSGEKNYYDGESLDSPPNAMLSENTSSGADDTMYTTGLGFRLKRWEVNAETRVA